MVNKKNRVAITVAILMACIALITGMYVSQHLHSKKKIDVSQFNGALLDTPRTIGSFVLTGTDQNEFTNQHLKGQWTMVFFGFTQCASMCPIAMAELGKMYRLLEEKGVKTLPKVVMVTLDPDRDSLEKLRLYVKAFDPHFYGARGDQLAIKKLTRELGIAYMNVVLKNADGSKTKDIEHTGTVMLFNPKGQLNAFFTTPHQANKLASDYLLLIA